jgi:dihydrofolate synthase/folylpolyglutamate synthase
MPVLEKIQPSFFELTVAMAFDYFARQKVDFAVIETGLGGRLDSTNIVQPMISVITNISLDHQSMLGDTLPQIAAEKAGIIKPRVPVVIGEKDIQTDPIFESIAKDRQATLVYAQEQVTLREVSFSRDHFSAMVDSNGILADVQIKVGLMGHYQILNVATALTTMQLLCSTSGLCISEKSILSGLAEVVQLTGIQGRWQKLREIPLVIADSGHNYAGLCLAMKQLRLLNPRMLRIVFGLSRDKDYHKMLALLPVDAVYYWSAAALPRSLNSWDLQTEASRFQLKGTAFTSVKAAVLAAINEAADDDVIFIGGSSFVVGETLTMSL